MMNKLNLVLCTAALLTACGSENDGNGLQQTNVTGAEVIADKDRLDFALDFTLYPGAKVESHMTGAGQTMALFTSMDSSEAIMQYYRSEAQAQGFEITVDEVDDEMSNINARRDDGARLVITVTDEGDSRMGDLTIST